MKESVKISTGIQKIVDCSKEEKEREKKEEEEEEKIKETKGVSSGRRQ